MAGFSSEEPAEYFQYGVFRSLLILSTDIIAAIATPPGRGGIGVIRISGKNLTNLAKIMLGQLPKPRFASFCNFLDAKGQTIDQGIALYFQAPHSYTGEDVLELQGHGGSAVMNLLLTNCLAAGARLAQPGEFTFRAYLNHKIDLIQAESVAAIIEASTDEAARCALSSLQGHFSTRINELVGTLIALRMLVEATLDFPEDEIDSINTLKINEKLLQIHSNLEQITLSAQQGNMLQEGIRVAIVGVPNAGKSSLLNQLIQEEAAIVTDIPGTTRDTIQRTISIAGIPIHIIDTAGLRETADIVEKKGIERTHTVIQNADIVLYLIDINQNRINSEDPIQQSLPNNKPQITIFNKIDLINQQPEIRELEKGPAIYLSAKTGMGIELLRQKILDLAGWRSGVAGEGLFMARQRHLEALRLVQSHIMNAQSMIMHEFQLEILAEELRLAQDTLSSITGEFTADDLLGEIFSHFCIGK